MKRTAIISTLALFTLLTFSQPIAQWRGPDRTGIYPETGLLTEWPKEGPGLIWSVDGIGNGFSSAVSDGVNVYVTGVKGKSEFLSAIDKTGKIIWQAPFGISWKGSYPDSRCTPTVDSGNVYVLSGGGILACINKLDGKIIWSLDGVTKFDGAFGQWGICESLLVLGDTLFYTPAGLKTTMVALNKYTGETIWTSESINDTSAYVSPRLINYGNKRIVVNVLNDNLIGVDAETGKILWKYNYGALSPEAGMKIWPGAPHTNTITPLFNEGMLYITGGYNHVGAMFRLSEDASSINLIWTDTTLDCHHGGVVLADGNIYGSNWFDNSRGNWCSIDWKTGKMNYETNWFTKGSIIFADGMLYCYEEKNGNVGLVKPGPEKFEVICSFKVPSGKGPHWAHPTIRNGILYIRHGDVIMAYDIRTK